MRFMCLLTGGQSGQFLNSGGSQEAGKTLLQRDLLDFNADLVPLGILDGGRQVRASSDPERRATEGGEGISTLDYWVCYRIKTCFRGTLVRGVKRVVHRDPQRPARD